MKGAWHAAGAPGVASALGEPADRHPCPAKGALAARVHERLDGARLLPQRGGRRLGALLLRAVRNEARSCARGLREGL